MPTIHVKKNTKERIDNDLTFKKCKSADDFINLLLDNTTLKTEVNK